MIFKNDIKNFTCYYFDDTTNINSKKDEGSI